MSNRDEVERAESNPDIAGKTSRTRRSKKNQNRQEADGPAQKRRKVGQSTPRPNQNGPRNTNASAEDDTGDQRANDGENLGQAAPVVAPLPPNPRQRKTVADVLSDLYAKSSTQVSAIATNILGSMQNAQERVNSIAADIGRHFSGMREEGIETREMLLVELRESKELFSKCLKTLEVIATRNVPGNVENDADEDLQLKVKAKLVVDLAKYLTCIQFLDPAKGIGLFSNTTTNSATLIEAANLVEGSSSSELAVELLEQQVPDKRRCDGATVSVAASACRGKSRVHDNLRKSLIRAFEAGLPLDHVLNPAKGSSASERVIAAKDLFDKGSFKFDDSLSNAWKSACRAAVLEARSTADSIKSGLQERLSEFQNSAFLPEIPEFNPHARLFPMSPFSQGFVSMKLTKFLQVTGRAGGPRLNKSHGPFWAQEVVFLDDALKRMNARLDTTPELNLDEDPVVLRVIHGTQELSSMEVGAMQEMIKSALKD